MNKIACLFILALASALNTPSAAAQSAAQIAIVQSRTMAPYEKAAQGIQEQFKEENVEAHFDFYNIEGDIQKGREVCGVIQEKQTGVIFTIGTEAFQAVSSCAGPIPVVTAMLVDPETEGIVSEGQAGVYGAYLKVPFSSRFLLLKKMAPALNPITLIYLEHREPGIADIKAAASHAGIDLVPLKIESIQKFSSALEQAAKQSRALMMIFDSELYNSGTTKELLLFSARHKFPIIAFAPNYVKSGALLSFSSDFFENGKSAGRLGAALLRKETPETRFVPTGKIFTVWNTDVAEAFRVQLSSEGKKEVSDYA